MMRAWVPLALLAGAGATLVLFSRSASASPRPSSPSSSPEPRPFQGHQFAIGSHPVWPLRTSHARGREVAYVDVSGRGHGNLSRRFGADRPGHFHHGMDLYCNPGDPCVATEPGRISGLFNTFHLGTGAVVLVTDSGLTLVYGEIGPGTWADFGVRKGMRVTRGQPLARVEPNSAGTWMLHLEIYAGAFSTNDPPLSALLDPTVYLLEARANVGVA